MTNSETIARRFHDDWVLVPRKITEAMCDACHDVPIGFEGSPPHPQHIWDAMLAAAPPAPVVTDEMVERDQDLIGRLLAEAKVWPRSDISGLLREAANALTAGLTPRDDAGEG